MPPCPTLNPPLLHGTILFVNARRDASLITIRKPNSILHWLKFEKLTNGLPCTSTPSCAYQVFE